MTSFKIRSFASVFHEHPCIKQLLVHNENQVFCISNFDRTASFQWFNIQFKWSRSRQYQSFRWKHQFNYFRPSESSKYFMFKKMNKKALSTFYSFCHLIKSISKFPCHEQGHISKSGNDTGKWNIYIKINAITLCLNKQTIFLIFDNLPLIG